MSDETIYTVTDRHGDKFRVETASLPTERPEVVYVDTAEDGVYMTPEQIDALRAALVPYGTPALARDGVREIVRLVDRYGDHRATRAQAALGDTEPSAEWAAANKACEEALGEVTRTLAELLERTAAEPEVVLFLAEADPGRLTLIPEPSTLDVRRVAALEKAAELAGRNALGGQSAEAVVRYAAFLLTEVAA